MNSFLTAAKSTLGRLFRRLARKDSGLAPEIRYTLAAWAFYLMPITGGGIQPGPLNAASFVGKRTNTADASLILAAATGRRLLGYEVSTATQTAAGALLNGASTVIDSTNLLSGFTMKCDDKYSKWFGTNGIACESGITLDWQAGSFDIVLFYLDAP